jgi:hypothetical protein
MSKPDLSHRRIGINKSIWKIGINLSGFEFEIDKKTAPPPFDAATKRVKQRRSFATLPCFIF